jgi:hypothetical protein
MGYKIVVFNSKGKIGKEKWKLGTKEIKEVKSFKYLGFIFNRKLRRTHQAGRAEWQQIECGE